MAMVFCRECKKQVSSDAPACPHCGVLEPGKGAASVPSTKDALLGFLALAAIVGGVLFACSEGDTNKANTSSQQTTPTAPSAQEKQQPKDFGITPSDFRNAYNNLLQTTLGSDGQELRMGSVSVTQGESADSFKQSILSGNTYIIGRVSKRTGKVDDLMIGVGGGSGGSSIKSASHAIMATVFAVRAVSGLDAESGVGNAITEMLGEAAAQLRDPSLTTEARMIGGYRLHAVGVKDVGILLSVSR